MTSSWTRAILEAAYRRGWLLRSVQSKVTFLLERGLHLEQALLGTGLLTMTQYAELVNELFGITLERLDQDRWTLAATTGELPEGVEAAINEDKKPALLVSDAWEWTDASWMKKGSAIIPVFRSDVLRWKRRIEPVDFAVSVWWEALTRHQATEARLSLEQGKGEVWLGADAHAEVDLELAREEVPALQAWFEAGYPTQEWVSKRIPGLESDTVEMVHKTNDHPLNHVHTWQAFLRESKGVMVCLSADAWLEQKLEHLLEARDHATLLAATGLVRVRPQSEQDREAAWHAALSGCALCWMEDAPHEHGWMRRLAQAGVPVRVVRSRPTAQGSTWEAYTISV